ncbi:MAG: alpha/beta hydrolase, partial [Deltaproteobacteria bacterium]|nr:alpha/beta hydrolase [Deltaproteobacteria bacterium]
IHFGPAYAYYYKRSTNRRLPFFLLMHLNSFLFTNQARAMTRLPINQKAAAEIEIPYLAQAYPWNTKILISNPGEAASSVILSYRDTVGQKADEKHTFELKAHGSTVIDLGNLERLWNLEAAAGGSLLITSDEPGLVAVATCDDFSSGGSFYSGIFAVSQTPAAEDLLQRQTDLELQSSLNWWNVIASQENYQNWHSQALNDLEAECEVVDLPGFGQVSYAWLGDRHQPVILVSHGGLMGYDNAFMLTDLMAGGFSLLCPSRPGYPGTPLQSGINDSFELAADMLAALSDYLHIDKVFIFGTSAGGPTALQFALRHQDRVQGVLLFDAVSLNYRADMDYPDNFVVPLLVPQDFQDPKSYKLVEATSRYPEAILRNWFELVVIADPTARERLAADIAADPASIERLLLFTRTITPASARYNGTINDSVIMATLPNYPLEEISVPVFVSHSLYDGDVHIEHGRNVIDRVSGPVSEYMFYGGGHLFFLGPQWSEITLRATEFMKGILSR